MISAREQVAVRAGRDDPSRLQKGLGMKRQISCFHGCWLANGNLDVNSYARSTTFGTCYPENNSANEQTAKLIAERRQLFVRVVTSKRAESKKLPRKTRSE